MNELTKVHANLGGRRFVETERQFKGGNIYQKTFAINGEKVSQKTFFEEALKSSDRALRFTGQVLQAAQTQNRALLEQLEATLTPIERELFDKALREDKSPEAETEEER